MMEAPYVVDSEISSTIYYSSIPEAITTFSIMSVVMIISLIAFIHTIYKFFCEEIALFEDDDQTHSETRTNIGRGRSGSSSTRSHVPKLSSTGRRSRTMRGSQISKPRHSKEISFLIAGLTMGYLFCATLYSFINWIIRLLMIFFQVNVTCYALGYVQIFYVLLRISFYVLFVVRLHLTFSGSSMAVKQSVLIMICAFSIISLIIACIYFLFDVLKQYKNAGNDCSENKDFNFVRPLLPAVIIDTTTSIILLYLFINKLSQLIRVQTSSIDSFNINMDTPTMQRIINLILIMTKLSVLVCVYIIGYWIILFLFLPILPGAAVMIDISIGIPCVLFCYEFHQNHYDKYCFGCKWICYNICFFWFIIYKEESNAVKRFGCCNIICCRLNHHDNVDHIDNTINDHQQQQQQQENNVEQMIMTELNVQKTPSLDIDNDNENENENEDETLPEITNKVNSLSASEMFGHDRTQTFVINLNVDNDDNKLKEEINENEDEEDGVITKCKTNTFDYRAQRLKEMRVLFFGDESNNAKNNKLMNKMRNVHTDFEVHRNSEVDHKDVVKKSQTAVL